MDNLKSQSASLDFCRSFQWHERNSDWLACCLDRLGFSSLIGGSRLFNTPFYVMLSIAVLSNEMWVLASNGNTAWLCLLKSFSFISRFGRASIVVIWWQTFSVSKQCTRYCAEKTSRWSSTYNILVSSPFSVRSWWLPMPSRHYLFYWLCWPRVRSEH